jgi:hypothetical protein
MNRTGTGPITVSIPPQAAIVSHAVSAWTLTLTISCTSGSEGRSCTGPIAVTATGGQTVGGGSYSVANGKRTKVTIDLNTTGQNLLSTSSAIAATISLPGTTAATATVRFHDPRIFAPVRYDWDSTLYYSLAQQLEVTEIPSGSTVEVICHGGGCPFANNSFTPGSAGTVNLLPSFAGRKMHVGSKIEIEVTHTDAVGEVVTLKIRGLTGVTVVNQCVQPGASKPSRCP